MRISEFCGLTLKDIDMQNKVLEELEAAKKKVEKVTGEKPITQKMFKAI